MANLFRRCYNTLKLDIGRIEQAQKYTLQAIQSSVDNAFGKYGFRKEIQSDGTVCHYGTGAANVGTNHDLMDLFREEIEEPSALAHNA